MITITSQTTSEIRKGLQRRHVGPGPAPADTRPVIGERTITEYRAEGIVSDINRYSPWVITLTDGDVLPAAVTGHAGTMRLPKVGDRIVATWNTWSDSTTPPFVSLEIQ